jgi:hypothetical protein
MTTKLFQEAQFDLNQGRIQGGGGGVHPARAPP